MRLNMENKFKNFIESIIYVFLVILVIFASVYGSIYVRLIPLLFILGIVGCAVFKRVVITTLFSFVVALCINYLKTPSDLVYVLFISATTSLNVALGEAFGRCIQKIVLKLKSGERLKNKSVILHFVLLLLTLCIELLIHDMTNGSIVTYQECRKKLESYVSSNYPNTSFKEINANYYMYKNPRYVFYLASEKTSELYKFSVYINEGDMIIDEYKEAVENGKIKEIKDTLTNCVVSLEDSSKYDDLSIKVKISDDKVCLEISKNVTTVDKESLENFAKEIVSYIEDIKQSSVYNEIYELDLSLKSTEDQTKNVVSIIYLDDYSLAVSEKSDISYKYILKAFNTEYDY